jgi:hypothetical protein
MRGIHFENKKEKTTKGVFKDFLFVNPGVRQQAV